MAPGIRPAAKLNTKNKIRRKTDMAILKDKKVIIIGDRDGIPGPAIEECVKTAGAEVVYSSTECFV
jgi:glycine reductase